MRKQKIVTDHFYHVFNRGVDKKTVFNDPTDYWRFYYSIHHCQNFKGRFSVLKKLEKDYLEQESPQNYLENDLFRIPPPVDIASFCLMPNHFHFCLKQLENGGISKFIQRLTTSYSHYFNIRYERTGCLFEPKFKAVLVKSEEQLNHVVRYIHLNPKKLVEESKEICAYHWSSLPHYLKKVKISFVNESLVLGSKYSVPEYQDFVLSQLESSDLERLSTLAIDDDFGWFEKYRSSDTERYIKLRKKITRYDF